MLKIFENTKDHVPFYLEKKRNVSVSQLSPENIKSYLGTRMSCLS